jgi:hypothetical protein
MCDNYLNARDYPETLLVDPEFQKKSLQPYAFIARNADPKGIFQVLQKNGSRYFLSLTTKPIRVYKEINEQ